MSAGSHQIRELYTERVDFYGSFIRFFRTPQGVRAILRRSDLLHPGLRLLDAGCGFGMGTLAVLEILRRRNLDYERIDGFDLTPAMLSRFERTIGRENIGRARLLQADALNVAALPGSWTDYDLILSLSLLEYLPKRQLSNALAGLRTRLAAGGRMLALITRRAPEAKLLIEWGWRAHRYRKEELLEAFHAAGFTDLRWLKFPRRYFWLNRANHVIVAGGTNQTALR